MALTYGDVYEARTNGLSMRVLCDSTGIDWVSLNAKLRDQSLSEEEFIKVERCVKSWKNGFVASK